MLVGIAEVSSFFSHLLHVIMYNINSTNCEVQQFQYNTF